ncbi:chaperonin Hsp60 mitochondrial precursor [Trypanosoma rangeli]|uniref:Chaperonin Hsp60 mitochondrial n=1 Tax=Trypanosoma rangeli TaxID=5698 RepID=A0A422NH43_TRYRA|nr:chaperonin Hsp60 mitochondrial precursor [Trypanosoma rangeli]RNF04786.1 chaperonin Hsp60 mitochondrial precursor [Trypanosoma rangeli]|eukprot:RNF04786.1 chaperonin Hsp60 mitochondrial precursor [Trypanosoma rangeli]
MKRNDPVFGYNAHTGEYADMFAAGIINPTKVVKSAVVNACSVAGMVITTEAVVVEKDMLAKEKRVEDIGIEDKKKKEGLNTMRKRVNESQAPLLALSPPMKFPIKGI